ncbi:aldehyde dehydrogenase family protein [Escherichia coli]
MGGNNPLIIDEVADIDAAVHLTIQSAFSQPGNAAPAPAVYCWKAKRGRSFFFARLVAVSQRLTPGDWDDEPQPFIGGLISEQAARRSVLPGSNWKRWADEPCLRRAYYNQRHRC